MKKLLTLLALALAVSGYSQAPIDNIPVASLLTEKFAISQGATTDGTSTRSSTIADYNLLSAFFLRGEIQSQNADNVIASLALGGGFYKTWESAKVYGFVEGRRNYTADKWEGVLGLGLAWRPLTDGVLSKFSLFTEPRLVTDFKLKTPPGREIVAGIRYSF